VDPRKQLSRDDEVIDQITDPGIAAWRALRDRIDDQAADAALRAYLERQVVDLQRDVKAIHASEDVLAAEPQPRIVAPKARGLIMKVRAEASSA
jgi:hypothetical protein